MQFSQPEEGVSKTVFLMGTLYNSNLSKQGLGFDFTAGPQAVRLRSPTMKASDTSEKPVWRNLPIELADATAHSYVGSATREIDVVSPKGMLLMRMHKGSKCNPTGRNRQTKIFFHCPDSFPRRGSTDHKISRVVETSVCHYHIYVATPLVCAHPRLMPIPERAPNVLNCAVDGSGDHRRVEVKQGAAASFAGLDMATPNASQLASDLY
eukprot:Selendium_serpulae@DN7920_c0_g1_i1.p1